MRYSPRTGEAKSNDPTWPENKADASCSVCCPWKKPYEMWGVMKSKLMNALTG